MSRSTYINMYAFYKHVQSIRSFVLLPKGWDGKNGNAPKKGTCESAIEVMTKLAIDSDYIIIPTMVYPTNQDSIELHFNMIIRYDINKNVKLFFVKLDVIWNNIITYRIYDDTENELYNGMMNVNDIDVNDFENIREIIIQNHIK